MNSARNNNIGMASMAVIMMILLFSSTFCMASITLAVKTTASNNQPTETNTLSTTDDSLSSTTTSISTSTTIQNLKQLFPGLWSYLPGKNASTVAIGDTNGFAFALTERTGEKKTYKGLLQIHANPKPQWLIIDVNSNEISYHFRATPTISTLRVDVRR